MRHTTRAETLPSLRVRLSIHARRKKPQVRDLGLNVREGGVEPEDQPSKRRFSDTPSVTSSPAAVRFARYSQAACYKV